MCRRLQGLSRRLSSKESTCQCRGHGFDLWVRKSPWRRKWQPAPVFLPRKSHGWRSLVGYSPWGCKESDTTWWLNNNITEDCPESHLSNRSTHSGLFCEWEINSYRVKLRIYRLCLLQKHPAMFEAKYLRFYHGGMRQDICHPLDISLKDIPAESGGNLTPYTGPTPGPGPLSHSQIKRNNLKATTWLWRPPPHPPHQNIVNGKRLIAKAEVS